LSQFLTDGIRPGRIIQVSMDEEFTRPMQVSEPERIKSRNKVVFNDIRISADSDWPSK
jgi:hypothetical protein